MYKLSCLFLLLNSFLCFNVLSSETNSVLSGKIFVESKSPLEGAQVILLAQKDSSFVKGTASDNNGDFVFRQIAPGRYFVQISMLGYKKEFRNTVVEDGKSVVLSPVYMEVEAQNLKAIVVTAKRPSIEIMADKTVVNIESYTLSSGNSALSVMQSLPGVIVGNDGSFSLNGKAGTKILIDGKTYYLGGTELINYLKSTPASALDKVELITNPSAKYEASGNSGIINIRTKKSKMMGFNMTLNSSFEQGDYGRFNNNVSFNHRNGKINIFGMYGYYTGHDFVDLKVIRKMNSSFSPSYTTFDQNSFRKRADDNQYFKAGIQYYLSDMTTFELSVNGYSAKRSENGTINSAFYKSVLKNDSTLNSFTRNYEHRNNFSSSLNMLHKFNNNGKELSFSLDYLRYSLDEDQMHNDKFAGQNGLIRDKYLKGLNNGIINMYSGMVDVTYPVSEKLSFDAGFKSALVDIDNASAYQNKAETNWAPDYKLSCNFLYRENINAAYISAKYSFKKLRLEAGIRLENTNVKGHKLANRLQNDSLFTQSYINIFPTVMLGYSINSMNSFNFSYGRRINRPNYKDLNPFTYIFDDYTYELGNTALKPQLSDNFNISYILKNNYNFGLFYSTTQNVIVKSYIIDGNKDRVYVMPTNMASYKSYGLRVGVGDISFVNFLHSAINANLVRNNYNWDLNDFCNKNRKTTFMFSMNNSIILPKDWTASISGFYNDKMAYGQMIVSSMWRLSAGIQKKFLNGNATLGIYLNDIFNSYREKGSGTFNGTWASSTDKTDRCLIGISFSYRFKKGYMSKEYKRKSESFDSKRINL
ncbi:outer membrane beta-barrel protein [Bacteroides sedimenti]|uniref:outer membrane beta-barrel protein n=1 Tax=Bacteroides sedimenti TaxID=2136147 RepID=UPI00333FE69C